MKQRMAFQRTNLKSIMWNNDKRAKPLTRTLNGGGPFKYKIDTSSVCYNAYTRLSNLEMCDMILINIRAMRSQWF